MNTICLNMIVKNEKHVIRRCLEAVKGVIDYWVIVDTGSTDGTQEIIRECMKGLPGQLYERPWRDFAFNRNEALDLAAGKGDYLLLVDADEVMHITSGFRKSSLSKDYYYLKTVGSGQEFFFPKLIRNDPLWRWVGALHETLQNRGQSVGDWLLSIWTESIQDGARSKDPQKHEKDIAILHQMVAEDPKEPRAYFYLAQTYFNAQKFEEALRYYQLRGQMEGAHDETFWSLFFVGQIEEFLKKDPKISCRSYSKAYEFDPLRAEPLERMANFYLESRNYSLGYILMKHASSLPRPTPLSAGCYSWVYHFAIDAILADCSVHLGKIQEAQMVYKNLLKKQNIPLALRAHAETQLTKIDQWNRSSVQDQKRIVFSTMPIFLTFRFG
ncbi:MAG: glycosyltransferase [Chlamydiales bacterium]|nr:glycosyltransferase [Chlamydiales bacterium]